jgi:hypothetical protein
MPVFDFESPDGKIISVLVTLKDPDHLRQVQIVDGVKYKRVYSAPLAAKDIKRGDGTRDDFTRLTTDKKGLTIGQMTELSKELSAEREAKMGRDPAKEKFYRDYEKRMGRKHQEEKRAEARKALEGTGIRIE